MNQYNVIDQTSSLDALENDFYKWSSLPYKFRLRADEECIRLHGCPNREYYEKQRAILLNGKDHATYTESLSYIADKDYQYKCNLSDQLSMAANIQILVPDRYNTFGELGLAFQVYLDITHKSRIMSDEYSRQIWGISVPDVYDYEKNRLHEKGVTENTTFLYENSEYFKNLFDQQDNFKPVKETISHMVATDDKVGLLMMKLEKATDIPEGLVSLYESASYDIQVGLEQKLNYERFLPHYVPYLTPDEMLGNTYIESLSYDEWKTQLLEAIKVGNEDELLRLGWNPGVAFTEHSVSYARTRQKEWLEHNIPTIVDVTNISERFDVAVTESSDSMRKVYKENNLYPVYIVLSFTGTPFGHLINLVKKSMYSHAAIALDSDLNSLYTFTFGKNFSGFKQESIQGYIKNSNNAIIDVLTIFVDKKTKDKIEKTIKTIEKNKDNTRYGFGNILNMLINRATDMEYPDNLALVCSQFVDMVFKLSNIDLFDKPNNLVLPQDFADIANNNKKKIKIFKIYEGLAKEYTDKLAERNISVLFAKKSPANLRYTQNIHFDPVDIKHVKEAEDIFQEMTDLLTPEAVCVERYIPVKFSDDGDLHIAYHKDLEQQYQESHQILLNCTEENTETMKHELAKLFAMNSDIERRIKKMKKNDPSYKNLVSLRARILNDFKKYIKVVLAVEPDFDFGAYFKQSEYYNGAISIHSSTLKYTGQMIKAFLKSQGL